MSILQMLATSSRNLANPDSFANNLVIGVSGSSDHGLTNVAGLVNTSTSTFSQIVPRGSAQSAFSTTNKYYNTSWELGDRPVRALWCSFENPTIAAFGSSNFTLETWVYIPTFTGLTQCALWSHTNDVDNTGFQCFICGDSFGDVSARRGIFFTGGAGAEVNIAYNCLSPNTWHHIAVVRNGSASNSLKIYVDGVDRTSYRDASGNPNWTYNQGLVLAAPGSETGWNTVKLQDYRVYQGVAKYTSNFTPPGRMFFDILTAASDPNAANLILAAPFGVGFGTTDYSSVIRGSGSSYTLESVNSSIETTDPKWTDYGGSLLAGANNASTQRLYTTTALPAFRANDFCIEGWLYMPSSAVGTSGMALLYNHNDTDTGFAVTFLGNDTSYPRALYFAGGAGAGNTRTSQSCPLNQWFHFAFARSGSTIRIFINGVNQVVSGGSVTTDFTGSFQGNILNSSDTSYNTVRLQDYRIYQGVAKYTSNFTPPIQMFI